MPKVKNPLLSMEARGGIGGLVYNTWRGINYVKTNTSPTGQGTAKRLAAQARLSTTSKLWQALDDVERTAWSQYATDHPVTDWTGSPKRLTGMNWYIRCTNQLARLSVAAVDTPPVIPAPSAFTGLSATLVTGDIKLAWTTPITGDLKTDVWIIGPLSAGVSPKIQRAKFLSFQNIDAATPIVIVTAAAVGRWTVFARVMDFTTGLVSGWTSDFIDVV